jgi:glucosylceramidase
MRNQFFVICSVSLVIVMAACTPRKQSSRVWLTSAAGDRCAEQAAVVFKKGAAADAIVVNPHERRQTIDGFGNSITESSVFVLACLTPERRHAVLEEMYGADGADFTASRTVVGSSDFALKGHYSYDDVEGDEALTHFSMAVHQDGFSKAEYPQIKDESYDMWQCLHEIAAVKAQDGPDAEWRLVASPWTAPAWMKDNKQFFDRKNRYGGALLPQYYDAFARYYIKYLQAYRDAGIRFWAITPENEPMGNDGSWESMHLSPEAEAALIGRYLGPQMEAAGFGDVKILGFDQNTFEAAPYTAAIFGDSLANRYTDGTALHWYGSTVSCFPEVLDSLHDAHPGKRLIHTEGCVDNLGRDGWPGVSDYEGYKECCWFKNDDFWWTPSATDWAYSTPWWPDWHPKYAVVHRYASYIIDGLNHWLTGYIDWNAVLDSVGGPTHVFNHCGAMLMVDYLNDELYFTPYYYVLKQFSRSMRPGDVVLGINEPTVNHLHVCAVAKQDGSYAVNILNTGDELTFPLQIGEYTADIHMPANAVKTIIVKL